MGSFQSQYRGQLSSAPSGPCHPSLRALPSHCDCPAAPQPPRPQQGANKPRGATRSLLPRWSLCSCGPRDQGARLHQPHDGAAHSPEFLQRFGGQWGEAVGGLELWPQPACSQLGPWRGQSQQDHPPPPRLIPTVFRLHGQCLEMARSARPSITLDLGSPFLFPCPSLSLFYFSLSFVSPSSPGDSQPLSFYIYTSISLSVLFSVFLSPYLSFASPYPDPGSSASACVCLRRPVFPPPPALSPSKLTPGPDLPEALLSGTPAGSSAAALARPHPGHCLGARWPLSCYQLEMNQRLGNGGVGVLSPGTHGALS